MKSPNFKLTKKIQDRLSRRLFYSSQDWLFQMSIKKRSNLTLMIWFLTTPKQCNQPSQIIPTSIDQVDLTVERGGNEEKTAVKDGRIKAQAGEEVDRGTEKLKLGRS